MKIERKFIYGFSLILSIAAVSGLRCWECENVYSQEECLSKGRMVECEETQNTCQITLRHGGWGPRPIIEKACKQLSACGSNHVQDLHRASVFALDTQCNRKPPSSVCRCCCSTDGCNHEILFCDGPLGGGPCNTIYAPRNGYMECRGGMMPQSECQFSCRPGYKIVGSPVSRCDLFSRRDYPAPRCRAIRCHGFVEQRFGSYSCNNGNRHRSRCRFTCEDGYRLHGFALLECIEDEDDDIFGVWSHPQPECRPLQCATQTLRHGRVECSDRNFVGSTCRFACNEGRGFQLFPEDATSNRCQRNELWTRPQPCCSLPCPPFALMDFVVILDSSSSVGADNWIKMKNFVRLFLMDFAIRDDATHVAVIRYNREVDTSTQILLNDYPNNIDGLVAAFDEIPYDGSGTHTGNALNYTASTVLRIGNRPNARDVVLLITDGASQDDVVIPSANLHATNALIFVLPVLPPVGRLDLDEIEIIARNPNNILRDAIEGGFDALDEDFARRISRILCGSPCSN